MSNIYITGSSGFVGKNLVEYLNKSIFTIVKYNRETNIDLKDINAIVHLAGKAHDLKKTSNPEDYYKVNFELTKNIYDEFIHSEAKTFIFISSVKAVADKVAGSLTENIVPAPVTDYGKSKLMAEEYILTNMPKDKNVYILRPCMIHGPGNKGNLNLLYSVVKLNIPWPLTNFENSRSFLSIDNLCFVINEMLIRNGIKSGVYNIADDEPISTNQLIEIISNVLGRKGFYLKFNKSFIKTTARFGDLLHLPFNTERLQKLTESFIVDNIKLKKELNISNLPIDSVKGLKNTIQSFAS